MSARTRAIFPFLTENSLYGQIWSKKIKLVNWKLETPSLVKEAKRSAIIVSAALRELWDYNTSRNSM